MVYCGTCAEGEDCKRGTCVPACTPRSCAGYCGTIDDGCGWKIDCGSCPGGQICTHENRCCTPTSCEAQGVECGEIFDRCRHIEIFCGTCAPWATCEGGKCVECHSATDCPLHGMDPDCVTVVCNSGSCDYIYAPSGTPVPDQDAGDCRKNVCDGHGNVVTVPDDTDLPFVHGNECMLGSCLNGTPVYSPVDAGVPCSQAGGSVCNGGGACVQCLTASDCPGQDNECATRTCTAYFCGFSFAFGTSCGPDGNGICDGAGTCVS
jgi:hypothetical protein